MSARLQNPRWRRWLLFAGGAALILLAADYAWFRVRDKQALDRISVLGGRVGSLMGWPIGKEYVISFRRPLSDDDLDQLQIALDALPRRPSVMVVVAKDTQTDERLTEIRRRWPRLPISPSSR